RRSERCRSGHQRLVRERAARDGCAQAQRNRGARHHDVVIPDHLARAAPRARRGGQGSARRLHRVGRTGGAVSDVLERVLRYVQYDTQSDERSATDPSTGKQLVLLRDLAGELAGLGLTDASVDEHGYVMATIPPTTRKANVPTIGFIAHVDTSPEMNG